ncbi:hypothetical protein RIF29_40818 [Crotalaria pallida]|uniref:Thymidine kinase n=1 Tax=Crotalaria pallida TaxID=3830 RepID=A0AAN9E478_CROPI
MNSLNLILTPKSLSLSLSLSPHLLFFLLPKITSSSFPTIPFRRNPTPILNNNLRMMMMLNSTTPSPCRTFQTDPSRPSSSGEIHVFVGPMFAGKTTSLLRRLQSESSNGRNVAVIKSNKDTRYGLDSIVTHDGEKFPCLALTNLASFKQKLGVDAYVKLDVIGIDEAQFFGDLYDFCHEAADYDGKTVIVAGLDGNYLRRSFGSVLDIIPLADSVTKLASRCEICGKRALFTLRKTQEKEIELIGGADLYMPVCRQHYVDGQAAVEATRYAVASQKAECAPIHK